MKKVILIVALLTANLFAKPPSWIDNPTNDKFMGEVGIVKSKIQRRLAIMKARASLLESIKVYINSKFEIDKICTDEECKKTIKQQIVQKANGCLKNSFVQGSYTDSDNYFYVWVVIKNNFDKDYKCED